MSMSPQDMTTQLPTEDCGARPGDKGNSVAAEASRKPRPLDSIRFSVVSFDERAPEIIELRRAAYSAAYTPDHYNEVASLTDPRDRQASVVIAELEGQIIASARLRPPLPGPILHANCRLEGSFSALPPKSELLECGWLCIHPDHQGKGLVWPFAAHKLAAAQQHGRPYIVAATEENNWPIWRSCGYRKIALSYRGAVTGIEYSVILLDLAAVLAGQGIAPALARALQELR